MPKLPQKICFIFFGIIFILFFVKFNSVNAANPQDIFEDLSIQRINLERRDAFNKAATDQAPQVFDQPVKNRDTALSIYSLANTIGCTDPEFCNAKSTALGTVAYAIGTIYAHPPASGIYYAYDVLQNSGFITKPVYAEGPGLGFAGLSPLLPIWKVTRNIAYAAIILVMVIIGFMVIFRAKIDPKTVISVQAAIPKIIFSIILITLSYPIAGFMVDLMYLTMGIVISLLAGGFDQSSRVAEFQTYFMTADFGDLFKTVFSGGFSTLDDFFIRNNFTGFMVGNAGVYAVSSILASQGWALLIGGGAIGALFILILFLGLLFTFIRIFLLLLNSYIQLLIAVVLAPLHLLFEAIPGRSAFSEWILNIMANLVVFPTTVAVLMFAEYITQLNTSTKNLFAPPFIGFPIGTTGVLGFGAFPAFLGLGILFLAPTLIATVKKQFHPKPFLPITAGTAFAPLTGGVQTAMGAANQFYYAQMAMQSVGGLFGGKDKKHG